MRRAHGRHGCQRLPIKNSAGSHRARPGQPAETVLPVHSRALHAFRHCAHFSAIRLPYISSPNFTQIYSTAVTAGPLSVLSIMAQPKFPACERNWRGRSASWSVSGSLIAQSSSSVQVHVCAQVRARVRMPRIQDDGGVVDGKGVKLWDR